MCDCNSYICLCVVHSSIFTISTGMGKRKLRFDHRKNYERKKRKAEIVKAPVSMPPSLIISLPLILYNSLPATSPSTLFSRLSSTGSLQAGWLMTDPLEGGQAAAATTSLILYKMDRRQPSMVPFVLFTVTITGDCTWILTVCERQVDIERCSLLSQVPPFLRTVNDVVGLLSMLNCSKFCSGNKETKFMDLAADNGGVFKDKQGNLYTGHTFYIPC